MADELPPQDPGGNVDLGAPTPPAKTPPNIEAFLADQANEAIKAGGDPQMVTARLGQMVAHLRAHPDVHQQANEAITVHGADPYSVAGKLSQLARHVGIGAPKAEAPDPTIKYDGTQANAGLVPSALHGATFGLSHKLLAGVDAAGDALAEGLHHPTEDLSSTLGTAYDQNLAAERAAAAKYAHEHPTADRVAEIAGGVGTGLAGGAVLGAGAKVANMGRLAKIGSALTTGATTGAVYGVGEASGSPSDYAKTIAKDAALGAGGSLVALPVAAAAGGLARAAHIPQAVSWAAEHLAGIVPEGSAKRTLSAVAQSIGTKGKAADQIAAAAKRDETAGFVPHDVPQGVPVMALNTAGPNVEALAENIANRPGTGRAIIQKALTDRQAQMRPSVSSAFDRLSETSPEDGEALLRQLSEAQAKRASAESVADAVAQEAKRAKPAALMAPHEAWQQELGGDAPNGIAALRQYADAQKAEAARLYGAAREATAGQPAQSATLDQILQTPAGRSAYGWAKMQMANRNKALPTVAGEMAPPPGFSQEQWDSVLARMRRTEEAPGTPTIAPPGPPIEAGRKADYSTQSKSQLLDLLRQEQGVLDAESTKASGGWSAVDENTGVGRGGGTLSGGMAKKRAGYAVQRIDAIEQQLRDRHGLSADDIAEHRFGSPDFRQEPAWVSESAPPPAPRPTDAPASLLAQMAGEPKSVPDPETLHYMKQYLAKLSRLGVNDGAQGTIATQAQGALGQWGNIRNELPEVWQHADAAFAKHSRLIDALNAGRGILRTQTNPAGQGKKALYTSLDALEQRVGSLSPEEQHAMQVGAQSAISDLLQSGKGVKGFVAQLHDPTSPMTRRVSLALGDPEAPARLAQRLAPQPNLLPAGPPVPSVSPELQAGARGLDVLRHGETAPGNAPDRSLPLLADARAAMPPDARRTLQRGAAQAVRGEFAGSGSPNPARVFASSPERVKQVAHAFADQTTANQFQQVVNAWANAQQQADRITGNSRTALRGSVEGARDLVGPELLPALASGHVGGVARGVIKSLVGDAQAQARDQLDREIAQVLTSGNLNAIPVARRAAVLRELSSRAGRDAVARAGAITAAR
jgi:hypothetical protein